MRRQAFRAPQQQHSPFAKTGLPLLPRDGRRPWSCEAGCISRVCGGPEVGREGKSAIIRGGAGEASKVGGKIVNSRTGTGTGAVSGPRDLIRDWLAAGRGLGPFGESGACPKRVSAPETASRSAPQQRQWLVRSDDGRESSLGFKAEQGECFRSKSIQSHHSVVCTLACSAGSTTTGSSRGRDSRRLHPSSRLPQLCHPASHRMTTTQTERRKKKEYIPYRLET